ncbi:MAG TPA: Fe-S cluster assembly ATPase SufC [Acidobacteriota bacterium]|nr:Fe-S cluster assembly ATPase SufC [Acidobacteriota bacterium]
MTLEIKDLHVTVEGKEILKGFSLTLASGKICALMGPNGSGKSTLASVLMGHPKYVVTSGSIRYNGTEIVGLSADERAKLGLFLSFQYPSEISGVGISHFLRTAYNAIHTPKLSVLEFRKLLESKMALLGMDKKFLDRSLNEGFSGGEKKRCEILQLSVLNPSLAILDETDSGLDIDALRAVSAGVNVWKDASKSVLLITHYKRILEYVRPDTIAVVIDGKIALSGDGSLVDQLESRGYGWILEK